MLFNSWQFALFFPLAIAGYFLLPHRLRWAWLLLTSCAFYMAFVPAYVLILFAVIGIDYAAGLLIARSEGAARRRWLLLSIATNLAMLGFFKYFNFFADNARALAHLIGWNLPLPILQVLLPIGLSFHVFQSLSYTIEVYRGHQAPERHLGIYAVYVMFWPQLVAGPIERPQNLLHQFHTPQTFDPERVTAGLRLMLWGFFKKIVVADRLALVVNLVYAHPTHYTGLPLLLATVFFAFQIYCDFSGYSDIARGAAKVMGIELMVNFRQPYGAESLSDFWRRWHISLSSWFRDYVYIPLGGNRAGAWRRALNLLAVFLLSGLWHGANWTFIVWGALHGTALAAGQLLTPRLSALPRPPAWRVLGRPARLAVTFAFVCLSWVFFRATSLHDAWYVVTHLLAGLLDQVSSVYGLAGTLRELQQRNVVLGVLAIATLVAAERLWGALGEPPARPRWFSWAACYAMILMLAVLGVYDSRAFIYFQF